MHGATVRFIGSLVFTPLRKHIAVRHLRTVSEVTLVAQLPHKFALNFRLHVAITDAGNYNIQGGKQFERNTSV